MKKVLFVSLFVSFSLVSTAIDFSTINTSYWYDLTADITVNHRVVSGSDGEIVVFFEINNRRGQQYQVNFLLQENFEDAGHVTAEAPRLDTLLQNGMQKIFRLTFRPQNKKLLVISVGNQNDFYYFPVLLKRGGLPFPSFYPTIAGIPVIQDFIKSDSVKFVSLEGVEEYYAFHYRKNFPPADPPMGIVQNINPSLNPDSLIQTDAVFEELMEYTFYFVQADTNSNTGLTLYRAPDYFPVYRSVEETLPTLTYFSKPSELSKIVNSTDKKAAFDRFWLDLYPTEPSARAAIKGYYLKVFAANLLFTDYKQGWKTDRGILYAIFGQPAEVYRSNYEEVWVYNGFKFEFRIISNLFAPTFYILKRDDKYQEEWFKKMKAIRGGN